MGGPVFGPGQASWNDAFGIKGTRPPGAQALQSPEQFAPVALDRLSQDDRSTPGFSKPAVQPVQHQGKTILRDGREEDRSRDWFCKGCGERNFLRRFECMTCKAPRPPGADGAPPAGPQAWEEFLKSGAGGAGSRRSHSKRKKKKKRKKSSSSTESSDSRTRRKRKKSSSSESKSDHEADMQKEVGVAASSEVDKAKAEVLQKLLECKKDPKDARIANWKKLLRSWHPDKNPDKVEVATAVFQFLQKGKSLI